MLTRYEVLMILVVMSWAFIILLAFNGPSEPEGRREDFNTIQQDCLDRGGMLMVPGWEPGTAVLVGDLECADLEKEESNEIF